MAILTIKIVDDTNFEVFFEIVEGFSLEHEIESLFEKPKTKFEKFVKTKLPGVDTKSLVVKSSSKCFYARETEESEEYYQTATILSVTVPKNPIDLVTFISIIDAYFKHNFFNSIRLGKSLITEELIEPARNTADKTADPSKKRPLKFLAKRLLHIGNEKSNLELLLENAQSMRLKGEPLSELSAHLALPLAHFENELTSKIAKKFFIRDFMIDTIIQKHPYLNIISTACLNGSQVSYFDKAFALKTAEEAPQELIEHLIQLRLQLLINSCLGKRAHDKGQYNEKYTELLLLRSAKFSINTQGLLSTELTQNPEFEKSYALNKRNHGLLKPELEFLSAILGWGFDETCDFKTTLVFNRAFTMTLMPELSGTTVESILESIESDLSTREDSSSQIAVSSNQASFFSLDAGEPPAVVKVEQVRPGN